MKSIWLASVCALAIPAAGFAQEAPASPAASPQGATTATPSTPSPANPTDAEEDSAPGDIIITATRRSQVLSDVPIAVSAVSAEQLKNSGGSDIRQLNQLAPSLLVSSATNENAGVARIRGIGTVGENAGLESSVAVFVDGVYRSRTGVGLSELGEVERIEVLRGPQGTLFGRNASAGLINIITAKPSFEFGGSAEATYGNFDNLRFQAGLTGPILGDSVAFRLDGVYQNRDGFLKDVISGRDLADRDRFLVRGQFLIQPSEDLSIRLIGDYSRKNEECCGAVYIAPARNLTRNPDGSLNELPNSTAALIRSLGGTVVLPSDPQDKYTRETALSAGRSYDQRTRDYGVSGEINYDLGFANITSISAYRRYKNRSGQDADFSSLDLLTRDAQNRNFETYTQELRLQGQLFDDRLDFLIGGYYANETLFTDDNITYGRDYERFVNAQIGGTLPLLASLIGYTPPAGQSLLNNTGIVLSEFEQKSRNYAFFTHNVVGIIPDKLLLTLGARYTNERKTIDATFDTTNDLCGALRAAPASATPSALAAARAGATALACVINNTSGPGFPSGSPGTRRNESEFTGTAVLSYKPVDELLVYGSYSRGYKAGGFNLDSSALDLPNPAALSLPANTIGNGRPEASDLQFAPEIVDAFEIGAKLDFREFKLNAALFYQSFENFQLNTFNGVNFEVANISACKDDLNGLDGDINFPGFTGAATTGRCDPDRGRNGVVSKGVELESFIFPTDDLTLTAGITYTDTKYRENLTGLNGAPLSPVLFQLPGQRLSNSSEYVVTGSIAFTPDITDTLSALFYLDFRYQSELNTGSDLDFEKAQEGYGVANGRIGLYGKDKIWGVEFWGQNLFDIKYQQIAADAPLQGGGTLRATQRFGTTANGLFITFPAEPRTYGITVRTRF